MSWKYFLLLILEFFPQDGHPPLEWSDTLAYLVLPMLLVVSQYISVQIMQSSQVIVFTFKKNPIFLNLCMFL